MPRPTKPMPRNKTPQQRRRQLEQEAPGRGVTMADREAIFERDGWTCQRCGSTEYLTLDHVIPLSRGGRHDPDNLCCLCWSCNVRKGTSTTDYRKNREGESDE